MFLRKKKQFCLLCILAFFVVSVFIFNGNRIAKAQILPSGYPGATFLNMPAGPYQSNPYQYNPYQYQFNPYQYQYNPYQYQYNPYQNPYQYNPYQYNPYQYQYNPYQNPYQYNPYQYQYNPYQNPYQYNPYQYNPYQYQYNPYQNPYQYNPYQYPYNPYQYNPYQYNPYQYPYNPYQSQQQFQTADFMLDSSDDNDTVTVDDGDTISIILASNVTTGYSWVLVTDELNTDIVKKVSNNYITGYYGSGYVGAGGYEQWIFEAESVGTTTIKLQYKQAGSGIVQDTFEVKIKVE
ncbi:protease inhibitor I42 family protein [bacterium]|nr:protease inhibitor I42 family protein [bacterium]